MTAIPHCRSSLSAREFDALPFNRQRARGPIWTDARIHSREKQYTFKDPNGKEIIIRDDAEGHFFGEGNPQNRGPHFNDPAGNHYDY